ncbi:MAG: DMT family transporter [Lachnospiraceae bacterium]|nr:DMT family transporter [Lachnospiraceae bacterium]
MNVTTNNQWRGYAFVLLGCAFWGTIGVFVKLMGNCGSTSELTSFLRMFFAFLIMLVITIVKDGVGAFKIEKRAMLACALLGLICQGIYNVCYSLAVMKAGVSVGAILLNVAPVFTAILSLMLFREKIGLKKWTSIVLKIAGCLLASGAFAVLNTKGATLSGILFGVAAGCCYALTPILSKIAGKQVNVFVMSTYSYLFAALFLGIATKPWTANAITNPKVLGLGVLFALIPTAIGYVLYYEGVNQITETSKVPVFASSETVFAIIFGILIFQESFGFVNGIGILLIFISIIFIEFL